MRRAAAASRQVAYQQKKNGKSAGFASPLVLAAAGNFAWDVHPPARAPSALRTPADAAAEAEKRLARG